MPALKLPSLELLNKLFYVEDGFLYRKVTVSNAIKGSMAGSVHSKGYRHVRVSGKRYLEHRIIWKMFYGDDPVYEIDHINGNRSDNHIKNLRDVNKIENARNSARKKNNTSGVNGVSWHSRDKIWRADIRVNGKQKYLGGFDNKEDAIRARKNAEIKYNYHENHGR